MKRELGSSTRPALLAAVSLVVGTSALDAQWTQFGGPSRSFHAPAGELAAAWPDGGPPVKWRRVLGDGYSGVLVDGDRLYTMYRRDGKEVVVCLERETGVTRWEHEYAVETTSSAQQFGDGPAATPAIDGDRLVAVGIGIDVHCLDKGSGELLWSRHFMEEFELPMPGRGYSPSPLVHGELVVLPIGGTAPVDAIDDGPGGGLDGGSVVALDLETGEIVWASGNFPGSKASPILIELAGEPHVVVFMGNELAGLDPESGEILWRFPHATDYGFNCTTPVFDGVDTLVCSSSYNHWTEAVQLVDTGSGFEARRKWDSRRMRIHFTNMVLVDGRVYGVSGMSRPGFLTCLDLETGERVWQHRGFAKANLLYANGPFVILDEDGQLALATFDDDGPDVKGRLELSDSHVFAAPTLVGTELVVRDRRYITAFDLSVEAVAARLEGEGQAFRADQPSLPADVESLLGEYVAEDEEEGQARLVLRQGWLTLELGEEHARLAPLPGSGTSEARWELVEDRTSGSTPRRLERLADEDGAVRWRLWSPRGTERVFRRTGAADPGSG